MKIGLLACSSLTGLGYQTHEFYKNMKPDKVLVYDLSMLNGMPTHHEWYPGTQDQRRIAYGLPSDKDMEWLVDGMDVVFVCETPLNYHLFEYAKKKGVKTVHQYNYEFLDYFRHPNLAKPSVLASPSKWNIEVVSTKNFAPVMHWSVPIDTVNIEFREIEQVRTLIHIIGRPAANDRNGTLEFIALMRNLGHKYRYKIYLQPPQEGRAKLHFREVQIALDKIKAEIGDHLEIIENVEDNLEMYKGGEILVLPRRYGGLCLPMWEALASGVPVIMPNVSPNNTILPKEWLVQANPNGSFQTTTEIKLYKTELSDLIDKVERVSHNICNHNLQARQIAQENSWEAQKPIYLQRFKELCES